MTRSRLARGKGWVHAALTQLRAGLQGHFPGGRQLRAGLKGHVQGECAAAQCRQNVQQAHCKLLCKHVRWPALPKAQGGRNQVVDSVTWPWSLQQLALPEIFKHSDCLPPLILMIEFAFAESLCCLMLSCSAFA